MLRTVTSIDPLRVRCCRRLAAVALLAPLWWAPPAQAQLQFPGTGLPGLPSLPGGLGRPAPLRTDPMLQPDVPLPALRLHKVRELLRTQREMLEPDPAGEPVRRGELLLISPAQATVDAALAQGFVLLRESTLDGLALRSVALRAPPGLATADARARLRALDPQLDVDFNHVYTRSGRLGDATPPSADMATPETGAAVARRIGLIDGGIDRAHPALRAARVNAWGCDGAAVPSPHGTAVASLLVGRDARFVGAAPGAALYAADVYCDQPGGGSAETVALALAWMARERVAVVNVSLVGPANRLLERAVQALTARGHLIVAAVGNDGPAAPPLYPASYAGVVGVTGVTPARTVLPEAARGAQVAFAAPGAELAVAQAGARGYVVARGTSYAAPLVAGLLGALLLEPDRAAGQRALRDLVLTATDLGASGHDTQYGWGLVGEQTRVAPARVQAVARARP